jgi:hypothetical protein
MQNTAPRTKLLINDMDVVNRAVLAEDILVFTAIYQADVNLVVYQRPLMSEVSAYAEQLLRHTADFKFSRMLPVQAVLPTLAPMLPVLPGQQAFLDDIAYITDAFTTLLGCEDVGIRLEALSKQSCPRFHCDKVTCRLLLTYAGPGTQWLAESNVDRSAIAARSSEPTLTACRDAALINQLNAGDIALLKGASWEGNEHGAVVHRSPPHLLQQQRLVLTLDPL